MSEYTHLGTLDMSGTVETPDGEALLIETEQGKFLLTIDELQTARGLSMTLDGYQREITMGNV